MKKNTALSNGKREKTHIKSKKCYHRPYVFGDSGFALRLHSQFIHTELINFVNISSLFDMSTPRNLLIIQGPLNKTSSNMLAELIKNNFERNFNSIYVEMTDSIGTFKGNGQKEYRNKCEELAKLKFSKFLVSNFISEHIISNTIKEL